MSDFENLTELPIEGWLWRTGKGFLCVGSHVDDNNIVHWTAYKLQAVDPADDFAGLDDLERINLVFDGIDVLPG